MLYYKWPLTLNILKRQYNAILDQHLLAFQLLYMEKLSNMKLDLYGQVDYITTDPKNMETILHTNFEDENRCQILNILRFKLT